MGLNSGRLATNAGSDIHLADAGGYITGDKNTENAIQEYGAQLSAKANTIASGGVCFTFDDGTADHLAASQILDSYNAVGTFYIISNRINTAGYLTAAQIASMSASHEIGSHGVTHVGFTTLNAAKLIAELQNSKTALDAITGSICTSIAYPFGAKNAAVNVATNDEYKLARAYAVPPNTYSNRKVFLIDGVSGLNLSGKNYVKTLIDSARKNNTVVVLVFHVIGETGFASADFEECVAYAVNQNVPCYKVSDVFQNQNLVADEDFERELSSWSLGNPTGSHAMITFPNEGPNSEKCIKFTGDGTASRVLYQEVPAIPGAEYLGRVQFQCESYASGTVFVEYTFYDINNTSISNKAIATVAANYAWQYTPAANRNLVVPAGAYKCRVVLTMSLLNGIVRLRKPQLYPQNQDVFN